MCHIAATRMKLLSSMWLLLLATLVGVSVQQCALEDLNVIDLVQNTESIEFTDSSDMPYINGIYYNCLSASQTVGLFSSTSLSVLYNKSGSAILKEVRYNLQCMNGRWERVGRTTTALQSNDTRTDCYSCKDQTVNDNHCSACDSSCTGLNQCYGLMANQCCSYNDGGVCTDDCGMNREGNSTFHCVCNNFWTGPNCDVCSLTCENGGTQRPDCSSCLCVAGYEGITCENEIDECDLDPCGNNGTCSDLINDYSCQCVAGYTDRNCTTDIDECDPNPCENYGTCTDLINGYSCECINGSAGKDCTVDTINDCNPDSCQNGGMCIDGINSYTCSCLAGFVGVACETDIDECYSNPCQNNGLCSNGINSYTCTCATGFTGAQCQDNINDCDPNPCKNGGTCTDGVNGFTCTCNSVYSGSDCSGCAMLNCEQCKESDENEMGECTECAGVFVLHQGTCNNNCGIPNCIKCDVVSKKCMQCQEGYKVNDNNDIDDDDGDDNVQCVGKTPEEDGGFKLSGHVMFGVILICIVALVVVILLIIAVIIKTGVHRSKKDSPKTYSRHQDETDTGHEAAINI